MARAERAVATEPSALLAVMCAVTRERQRVEGKIHGSRLSSLLRLLPTALSEGEILLAWGSDGPAIGRGMDRNRVIYGFTDDEAWRSWQATRQPGSPPLSARPIPGTTDELGGIFASAPITGLVLNAAGPASTIVYRKAFETRPKRGLPRKIDHDDTRIRPEGRLADRTRIDDLVREVPSYVAGPEEAFDTLFPPLMWVVNWGDSVRFTLAAEQMAARRPVAWRIKAGLKVRGDSPGDLTSIATGCAQAWSALGESDRCASQLIYAGHAIVAGLEEGYEVAPGLEMLGVVIGALASTDSSAHRQETDALVEATKRYS